MTTIKRIDGSVLEEKEGSIKEVIEELVSTWADLTGADLTGADLRWANLTGAFFSIQ